MGNCAYAAELLERAKECPKTDKSIRNHDPLYYNAMESFLIGYTHLHYYKKLGIARRYLETASKQCKTLEQSECVLSSLYIIHMSLQSIYEAHEDKDRSLMSQTIVN